MARRDLSNLRSVTEVQAVIPDQTMGAIASIGKKIVDDQIDAQFSEKMSEAQLKLNALNTQYQIDYEGNPMGGLKELDEAKKRIFQEYGSQISPLRGMQWQQATQELSARSDMAIQSWGLKQSQVNTKNSLKKMIDNDLIMASQNGQAFAKSGDNNVEAFLDYAGGRARLEQTAAGKIGSETLGVLLEDYDEDYTKVFLSSVGSVNPQKALGLLQDERVRASIKDPMDVMKLEKAFGARSNVMARQAQETVEIDRVAGVGDLIKASVQKPMDLAQLEQVTGQFGIDGAAKDLLLRLNGFAEGSKKLDDSQKRGYKATVYDAIGKIGKEEINSKNISAVQEAIITGMENNAIPDGEGIKLLNQIVGPLIEAQRGNISQYQRGAYNPFQDNIGFSGIESYFENNVKIVEPEAATKGQKTEVELNNKINKSKLYDYYMSALELEADALPNRPRVGDIPNLPDAQKEKLYSRAQTTAQELFLKDRYPALRTLPDVPNFVLKDGQLIQGSVGGRNLKPVAVAEPRFKLGVEGDMIYRIYPDGTKQAVAPKPDYLKGSQ